jgi:hypothetical protein
MRAFGLSDVRGPSLAESDLNRMDQVQAVSHPVSRILNIDPPGKFDPPSQGIGADDCSGFAKSCLDDCRQAVQILALLTKIPWLKPWRRLEAGYTPPSARPHLVSARLGCMSMSLSDSGDS